MKQFVWLLRFSKGYHLLLNWMLIDYEHYLGGLSATIYVIINSLLALSQNYADFV